MSTGANPDDRDDDLPALPPGEATIDRVTEGLLPCGHDPDCWKSTSGVHYNHPGHRKDGVLTILPGECTICETPIREFYSGEFGGPFLTREEFDPDEDIKRTNARIIDPDDIDSEDSP